MGFNHALRFGARADLGLGCCHRECGFRFHETFATQTNQDKQQKSRYAQSADAILERVHGERGRPFPRLRRKYREGRRLLRGGVIGRGPVSRGFKREEASVPSNITPAEIAIMIRGKPNTSRRVVEGETWISAAIHRLM